MKVIRWYKLAKRLEKQSEQGYTMVMVPNHLAAEAKKWVWLRNVEHANARWEQRVAEVPLEQWQATMRKHSGE